MAWPMSTQVCRVCQLPHPLDGEHFERRPKNTRGYSVVCLACQGEQEQRALASPPVNGTAGRRRTAARRAGGPTLRERLDTAMATSRRGRGPQLFARLRLEPGAYLHLYALAPNEVIARVEVY